jgi:hypothetical protein
LEKEYHSRCDGGLPGWLVWCSKWCRPRWFWLWGGWIRWRRLEFSC